MSQPDNVLIVADSEHDANMLYAVRMFVPDPFIYMRLGGKCHVVMRCIVDAGRGEGQDLARGDRRFRAPLVRATSPSPAVRLASGSSSGHPSERREGSIRDVSLLFA